jgi:hypothetical protein
MLFVCSQANTFTLTTRCPKSELSVTLAAQQTHCDAGIINRQAVPRALRMALLRGL